MSLYNMLFQTTPVAGPVLQELGVKHQDEFERARDAWIALEPEPQMVVLTRCGGHNREDHEGVFEKFRKHPLYISDEDDLYDSTYAYIRFRLPTDSGLYKEVMSAKEDIEKKWQEFVKHMQDKGEEIPDDCAVENRLDMFIKNGQPLKKMFENAVNTLGDLPDGKI